MIVYNGIQQLAPVLLLLLLIPINHVACKHKGYEVAAENGIRKRNNVGINEEPGIDYVSASLDDNVMTMRELISHYQQSMTQDDIHLSVQYDFHPHEQFAHRHLQNTIAKEKKSKMSTAVQPNSTTTDDRTASSAPSISPTTVITKPIRIAFDTTELQMLTDATNNGVVETITRRVLPKVSKIWSSILNVIPVVGKIPIPSNVCNGIVPNEISDMYSDGVSDADVVIFVSAKSIVNGKDLCREKTLASASFCNLDQVDRPVIGFMNFCLQNTINVDVEKMTNVGVHEVGHVLGWNDDLLKYFRNPETGEPLTTRPFVSQPTTCVDGSVRNYALPAKNTLVAKKDTITNATYYEIVTPSLKQVVRNQFGCQDLDGAKLENQPTRNSCIGAHFDERLFFTELMSSIYTSNYAASLSPLTVALMEDSGFYQVSYSSPYIKNSVFGLGAGCGFVKDSCIDPNTEKVSGSHEQYFCDTPSKFSQNGIDKDSPTSCDPSFQSIAYCDLFDFSNGSPEGYFMEKNDAIQYFKNPDLGVIFSHADYCPVPSIPKLDCTDSSNVHHHKFFPSETFGKSSRCVNAQYEHPRDGAIKRGACFRMECNAVDHTLDVYIDGKILTCEYEGQIHKFPRTGTATFQCPPISAICPDMLCPGLCSGKGICNYESTPPTCECFDEMDTSPGCFGRGFEVSGETRYNDDETIVTIAIESSQNSAYLSKTFSLFSVMLSLTLNAFLGFAN